MNNQLLHQEYNLEKANQTLTTGIILSIIGIIVIIPILYLEVSTYHSIGLLISRMLFVFPAFLFLLSSKTLFVRNHHLIIPFHTLTISGGVAMMVGVALVKYQIPNIPPAFKLATVNGGLIAAIFIMYIFSGGAKKYFKYTTAGLLLLMVIYFFLIEKLTWLEASPFINPLISGLGVIVLSIYSEKLELQEFYMRKMVEDKKLRLEEEIEGRRQLEIKLREQAMVDDLTGVFNRRACYSRLEESLNHAKNNQASVTICYIDLDNLKMINDVYGHTEGDNIIISLAQLFKNALREKDYICRIGGDEFLIILTNCDEEYAGKIIERLRERFRGIMKYQELDFSYGLSQYKTGDFLDIDKLIDLADQKMYTNKIDKKKKAG